jgi:hypothetical protein
MRANQDKTTLFIPLELKRKNGRPRIVASTTEPHSQSRIQDPHILKALGRAWAWRRKLESGEAATINDIAKAENVTDRFVSRMMRLAYLPPDVVEKLVIWQEPCVLSIKELIELAGVQWGERCCIIDEHNK